MHTTDRNISLALSQEELNRWQADGYFVREHQFNGTELELLRNAADNAATRAHEQSSHGKTYYLDNKRFVDIDCATVQYEHTADSNIVRVLEPAHLFNDTIEGLVDDPRLTAPMQTLIGTRALALWTVKLNMKSASGSAFGWHQDSPYWVHDCKHVDLLPNVMLALDAQHRDNGCLRVIAGSHQQGILPGTSNGTQLGGFFTSPDCFEASREVALEVGAGALIFFSPHCVHGSKPNISTDARRALIFTYQPGDFPMLKNRQVRNVST
jgi:phytanoyl-CoA hydroxylase